MRGKYPKGRPSQITFLLVLISVENAFLMQGANIREVLRGIKEDGNLHDKEVIQRKVQDLSEQIREKTHREPFGVVA